MRALLQRAIELTPLVRHSSNAGYLFARNERWIELLEKKECNKEHLIAVEDMTMVGKAIYHRYKRADSPNK